MCNHSGTEQRTGARPSRRDTADQMVAHVEGVTDLVARLLHRLIDQRFGDALHPAWYAMNCLIHMLLPIDDPIVALWEQCAAQGAAEGCLRLLESRPDMLAG